VELTNEFTVAAPIEQAWALLLDIERLGPCMPGAEVTSFDGEAFTGTVRVKLGPVNQTYGGKGRFVSRDPDSHTVVVEASGKDKRGSGTAAATVTGSLHAVEGGTRVHVVTDLHITGPAAQFGRGMIADVAGKLTGQFAACLADELARSSPPAAPAVPAQPAAPEAETDAAVPWEAPVPEAVPPAQAVAVAAAPKREVEPIDLLAVTGAKRNFVPYTVVFLLGAIVGAVIVALIG
jgi:carbon monoxide dehydrogenase subunit G